MASSGLGPIADQVAIPARCVDCGREIAEEQVFRVLRRGRDGRRHVVCQACADRRHAEAKPAALQIQRTPPPPSVLLAKRPGHQHTVFSLREPAGARSEVPHRP